MVNINVEFKKIVSKASKILNYISCGGIVLVMILVVSNVIMRAVFNRPILGTYEYTCFLTVIIVGCSLANCSLNNGHISLGFIMEKFKNNVQNKVKAITNGISLCFMAILTWSLYVYADKLKNAGELSLTTQTPFYIFVYITAMGFSVLCLVLIVKIIEGIKGVNIK